MLNGEGNVAGARPRLGSASIGELGGLEPTVNLVLSFWRSLDLRVEEGSGEGVLE